MIKCNQCGKMNAAGTVNCQSCGVPLSSTVDSGMSPMPASVGQPELPAWLESLRAGERSASPANTMSTFSAADFVDEDSLPSWMRAERNETRDNTGATPRVSVRPSSMPGPATDGERQQPNGIAARSLLDEQALPSWMREEKQSGPVPAQEKISASNLVQSENMPDWMKSLQQGQASLPGETGGGAISPAMIARSSQTSLPTPVTSPRLAGDSFTDSQLPMSQATSTVQSGQVGFSARDLIDPQALPSWMVPQGERAGQSAQLSQVSRPDTLRNPGQPAPGQTFSASSLLDENALPTWLRESGQRGQAQAVPPADPSRPAPSAASPAPTFGGGIPGSSLVDVNSAPEWMRQMNPQQSSSGPGVRSPYEPGVPRVPGTPQPNIYAGPPKVENVRVPNRPRHEVNANENSEVAANVFSSMLGVASSTPNYPAPSPQPQPSYQQPGLAGSSAQAGIPASGSGIYMNSGMGAVPNTPGISSSLPQGYAPGNSYSGSYQSGMSSAQMGRPPSAHMSQAPSSGPGQRGAAPTNEQRNVKKRGLFGAILEWLTR